MNTKETNEQLAVRILREIALGQHGADLNVRYSAARDLLYVDANLAQQAAAAPVAPNGELDVNT